MKMSSPVSRSKALIILNPAAGVQPVNFIVSKDLDRRKKDIKCLKSRNVEDTRNIIGNHSKEHEVIVAAGGDGTVHSVATQLVGSQKVLGVLPLGSGNGFAKEFGFKMNINALLSNIQKGESMDIDVIEINDHLCLNVAGIGLDSFVAHSFNELKLRGFLPYVWLTLKTFLQLKPFRVNVRVEDEVIFSGDLFVLTIANTRQFGNNAFIAPKAKPNDGKVDLVLIRPFPKYLGPVFILRLFTKKINKSKYVKNVTTDKVITIDTVETRFHIDGEPVEIKDRVVVRLKKDMLKVLKTPGNKFLK
jgi:YegS/Rv2252/BmrU family lipid kinase